MSEQEHYHLALFGFTKCSEPDCPLPRADPDDGQDMVCSDPDCEGGCEAARHNATRRERYLAEQREQSADGGE